MSQDKETGLFFDKKFYATIVLMTSKGNKTAGEMEINIAALLNKGSTNSLKESSGIKRCPDKNARFYYGYSFKRVQELGQDEYQ